MRKIVFLVFLFCSISYGQEKKKYQITWSEYEVETHTCQEVHGDQLCMSDGVHWNTVGQAYQNSFVVTGKKNRDWHLQQLEIRRPQPDTAPVDTYIFNIKAIEIE
ncbi:hypothetical protein [Flagellimonas marina]|uniref:DUF4377 domain-containing protein n=1 Tax=Flagellimonas marina TaxID=1775168 RepID=A0ABV8PKA1_9FLAO